MEKNKLLHRVLLTYLLLLALSVLGGCQSEEEKKFSQLEAYEKEAKEADRLLSIEPFKSYLETSPLISRTEVGEKVMDHQSIAYYFKRTEYAVNGFVSIHHRPEGSFTYDLFADTLSSIHIFIDKEAFLEPKYKNIMKELLLMVDSDFDFEDFYVKVKEREPLSDNVYQFGVGSIRYKSYHHTKTHKRVENSFISIDVEPYSDRTIEEIKKK